MLEFMSIMVCLIAVAATLGSKGLFGYYYYYFDETAHVLNT